MSGETSTGSEDLVAKAQERIEKAIKVIPRMKEAKGSLAGRVAVCQAGRIGVVQRCKRGVWMGIDVFDGGPWQAKHPRVLSIETTAKLMRLNETATRGIALAQTVEADRKLSVFARVVKAIKG